MSEKTVFISYSNEPPGDLQCCLLFTKALAIAQEAAKGGGSSGVLHRMLDLAVRWSTQGAALLAEFRHSFDSKLAASLSQLGADTLPTLIAESRGELPPRGDGNAYRSDNAIFKELRNEVWHLAESLRQALESNQAFVALTRSSQRWPILGFRDEAQYQDFLRPSLRTLARNSDVMQKLLFKRLLTRPEFSPRQPEDEGFGQAFVMDTVNALVTEGWAKWSDLSEPGSKAKRVLSLPGQEALKLFLEDQSPDGMLTADQS